MVLILLYNKVCGARSFGLLCILGQHSKDHQNTALRCAQQLCLAYINISQEEELEETEEVEIEEIEEGELKRGRRSVGGGKWRKQFGFATVC